MEREEKKDPVSGVVHSRAFAQADGEEKKKIFFERGAAQKEPKKSPL